MNLKQIFRSILRDRLNTLVMIISLAVGIACINLIFLFLSRELGTDSFHEYKDQICILNKANSIYDSPQLSMNGRNPGRIREIKTHLERIKYHLGNYFFLSCYSQKKYLSRIPYQVACHNFCKFVCPVSCIVTSHPSLNTFYLSATLH